ncbi:kinase-like domain-containing protein, partial [Gorgonomyces haynaldii]
MYKKGDADSSATVYEDASAVFVQGSQANETPKPHERVISHKRDKTTEPPASGRKFIGEWELGKTIGEGSSGKVKLAKHRTTGEMSHVNSMDSEALAKVYKRELYMIREATLGIMLNHPHLVKLYSAVLGENHFYCFFEFVQGEDLVDYITRTGPIPERQARKIFRKVLSAVEFTHRNHVVHRDIKLENVRYNEQTEEVKVLDFGFATFYQSNFLETNCGSPCYAAPEIYDNKPYIGTASDIWSLGVCLFGMATGTLPFDGNDFRTLAAKVRSGKVTYPAFLCDDLVQLISMMLKTNPRQRATLGQVMEHQWV